MNFRDPAMNLPLLKYLSGVSVGKLIEQYGNTVFERIYQVHFNYEIIDNKLYKKLNGIWK